MSHDLGAELPGMGMGPDSEVAKMGDVTGMGMDPEVVRMGAKLDVWCLELKRNILVR